ncbi:MAG: heavy-metal-associated domain-containing protein [Aquisalinus sp.]|nr:heavy-metal-associated domain-containing protein [Aquisalinus sp.]
MKKLLTLIIASVGLVFVGPALAEEAESRSAAEIVSAEPEKTGRIIQASVDGMHCENCADSISKVILREEAVEAVEVSVEAKVVTITVKEGMSLSDEVVEKAIFWAGYDIAEITRA